MGGVDVQLDTCLISAPGGGEWSASRLGALLSEKETSIPTG